MSEKSNKEHYDRKVASTRPNSQRSEHDGSKRNTEHGLTDKNVETLQRNKITDRPGSKCAAKRSKCVLFSEPIRKISKSGLDEEKQSRPTTATKRAKESCKNNKRESGKEIKDVSARTILDNRLDHEAKEQNTLENQQHNSIDAKLEKNFGKKLRNSKKQNTSLDHCIKLCKQCLNDVDSYITPKTMKVKSEIDVGELEEEIGKRFNKPFKPCSVKCEKPVILQSTKRRKSASGESDGYNTDSSGKPCYSSIRKHDQSISRTNSCKSSGSDNKLKEFDEKNTDRKLCPIRKGARKELEENFKNEVAESDVQKSSIKTKRKQRKLSANRDKECERPLSRKSMATAYNEENANEEQKPIISSTKKTGSSRKRSKSHESRSHEYSIVEDSKEPISFASPRDRDRCYRPKVRPEIITLAKELGTVLNIYKFLIKSNIDSNRKNEESATENIHTEDNRKRYKLESDRTSIDSDRRRKIRKCTTPSAPGRLTADHLNGDQKHLSSIGKEDDDERSNESENKYFETPYSIGNADMMEVPATIKKLDNVLDIIGIKNTLVNSKRQKRIGTTRNYKKKFGKVKTSYSFSVEGQPHRNGENVSENAWVPSIDSGITDSKAFRVPIADQNRDVDITNEVRVECKASPISKYITDEYLNTSKKREKMSVKPRKVARFLNNKTDDVVIESECTNYKKAGPIEYPESMKITSDDGMSADSVNNKCRSTLFCQERRYLSIDQNCSKTANVNNERGVTIMNAKTKALCLSESVTTTYPRTEQKSGEMAKNIVCEGKFEREAPLECFAECLNANKGYKVTNDGLIKTEHCISSALTGYRNKKFGNVFKKDTNDEVEAAKGKRQCSMKYLGTDPVPRKVIEYVDSKVGVKSTKYRIPSVSTEELPIDHKNGRENNTNGQGVVLKNSEHEALFHSNSLTKNFTTGQVINGKGNDINDEGKVESMNTFKSVSDDFMKNSRFNEKIAHQATVKAAYGVPFANLYNAINDDIRIESEHAERMVLGTKKYLENASVNGNVTEAADNKADSIYTKPKSPCVFKVSDKGFQHMYRNGIIYGEKIEREASCEHLVDGNRNSNDKFTNKHQNDDSGRTERVDGKEVQTVTTCAQSFIGTGENANDLSMVQVNSESTAKSMDKIGIEKANTNCRSPSIRSALENGPINTIKNLSEVTKIDDNQVRNAAGDCKVDSGNTNTIQCYNCTAKRTLHTGSIKTTHESGRLGNSYRDNKLTTDSDKLRQSEDVQTPPGGEYRQKRSQVASANIEFSSHDFSFQKGSPLANLMSIVLFCIGTCASTVAKVGSVRKPVINVGLQPAEDDNKPVSRGEDEFREMSRATGSERSESLVTANETDFDEKSRVSCFEFIDCTGMNYRTTDETVSTTTSHPDTRLHGNEETAHVVYEANTQQTDEIRDDVSCTAYFESIRCFPVRTEQQAIQTIDETNEQDQFSPSKKHGEIVDCSNSYGSIGEESCMFLYRKPASCVKRFDESQVNSECCGITIECASSIFQIHAVELETLWTSKNSALEDDKYTNTSSSDQNESQPLISYQYKSEKALQIRVPQTVGTEIPSIAGLPANKHTLGQRNVTQFLIALGDKNRPYFPETNSPHGRKLFKLSLGIEAMSDEGRLSNHNKLYAEPTHQRAGRHSNFPVQNFRHVPKLINIEAQTEVHCAVPISLEGCAGIDVLGKHNGSKR